MLSQIIWWIGSLLEALILFRGFRARILATYPFFYAQLALVFIVGFSIYAGSVVDPASYGRWYWAGQFLTMFVACGIILEILRNPLARYTFLKTFTKTVRLVLFAAVFCFVTVYLMIPAVRRVETTNVLFERDFRAFQAILLLTILGGIFFHRVPIGRNVKGMFLGYGLYVATSLIALSVRLYEGPGFDLRWYFLQPLSYTISVAIWAFSLWTYHPDPAPLGKIQLVLHDSLSDRKISKMMMRTWSGVFKAVSA
jgi:hypothetical protein